uniref:Uncharacterized protein n=1 Tax=Alexandrium catenella TaxID=2925 RepID=A0A7S1QLM4_ALECA
MQQAVRITKVRIETAYTSQSSKGARVVVSDTPFDSPADFTAGKLCTEIPDGFKERVYLQSSRDSWNDYACSHPVDGRYVGVILPGEKRILTFCELEVCGVALD